MKRIERYTHRQNHIDGGEVCFYTELGNGLGKGVDEEVIVFEYAQKTDIDADAQPKPESFVRQIPGLVHPDAGVVIKKSREHQQEEKPPIPASVEEVA